MNFYCIGTSYQTAPLETREQLSFSAPALSAALNHYRLNKARFLGDHSEIAILSTCNRVEIYAAVNQPTAPADGMDQEACYALFQFLSEVKDIPFSTLDPLFFRKQGLDAVRHLFRVAAGLESMILGEPQILGQVAEAHQTAQRTGASRHILSTLFRAALHAGKRARTETAIGRNPSSISSQAASLAEHIAGPVSGRQTLVIGAGEMSYLTAKALRQRGAQGITMLNRTYSRAVEMAEHFEGKARPFEELAEALQEADIVISSTGSSEPIIPLDLVQRVMQARPHRPLVLLDIALPRDVDPAVRGVFGVHLFDLNDLQQFLHQSISQREQEAEQVEAIVERETAEFQHWMEMIPAVGKLHRKAETIRQQEVDRLLQHLPDLDPQVREQVEHLSRSLVKKLLHEPTMKLRSESKNGRLSEQIDALKFLFGLEEDGANIYETPAD